MDTLKEIWDDYKKIIIIILSVIAVLVISLIVISVLYNPIKISFTGEGSSIIATMSNEIKIGAVATNKSGEKFDLSWEVSAGTLNTKVGSEVIWELPKEEGTYTIIVNAGDKSLSRNITILENRLGKISLEDNKNIDYIDIDEDGLSDKYEEENSNTDKNKKSTDDSLIDDGNKIVLKVDSKQIKTKEEVEKIEDDSSENNDGKEEKNTIEDKVYEYTLNLENIGAKADIKGKGNIVSTTIDLYDLNTLNEISSVCSKAYSITTSDNIDSINLTLKYDKNIISNKALDENMLAIYKLDVENNKYIKQETSVDVANSTLSASVKEGGKYFIADSSKLKTSLSTELMFVIDNSGSMYSKDMVEGSEENDTQFKRVDLSNRIIDKLKGDYKFGAGKFTFEYEELAPLSSDKEKVKEKINEIKTLTEKFSGTYIGNALDGGLKGFDTKESNTRRYLILLTDGKDTSNIKGYDEKKIQSAINSAKEKKVKVFTIGLGNSLETDKLEKIAKETGGKYYYASNSEILEDIFELIAADINYGFIDFDKETNDDYVIYKNNNFLSKENGMPVNNFSTTKNNYGATYGMSLFSKLYYENKLPSKMGSITVKDKDTKENIKTDGYELRIEKGLLSNFKLDKLEFMKEQPKDFMSTTVENGVLAISSEYKKQLNSYGCTYYNFTYNNPNAGFSKYEHYILDNEFSENKKSDLSDTDKKFINAIYRLDILKHRDERISFETSPDEAYENLISNLDKKEVPIIYLNGYYAVCVQKVLVDIYDDNNIKLEVYDSNYMGKNKYIDVKRTKIFNDLEDNNKNNYQYKFKYDGKNVSVELSIPNVDVNL